MAFEHDLHIAAQHHQAELLAEASARRLLRTVDSRREEPLPATNRLQSLLRRIAGAPTYA
jgi:hypothetical protein